MTERDFKDKFIAFIDILGFTSMVEASERGEGPTAAELSEFQSVLGQHKNASDIRNHGSYVCPDSSRSRFDLDLHVTQVSDCAVISAEISPLGALNVISLCSSAAIKLMTKGVMVRGYITRGSIIHDENNFVGTGYQRAYKAEGGVTAFKRTADERGTPFIEIDQSVMQYIKESNDRCLPKVLENITRSDGTVTAVFPFQVLANSFSWSGTNPLERERVRQSADILISGIERVKTLIHKYVDPSNPRAVEKSEHYLAALDRQIAVCNHAERWMDWLERPFGARCGKGPESF